MLYKQASEILKFPYLQPYVNIYRPSGSLSSLKPVSAVCETQNPTAESQNSSMCGSDKDSSVSTEKNIPILVYGENKSAETDIKSDGVNFGNPPRQNGQNCIAGYMTNMHEREVMRPTSHEPKSNFNVKKPNAIKNILMAAEVGKTRENRSPMRSNCSGVVQRAKVEVPAKVLKPTIVPPTVKPAADLPASVRVRACPDSTERVHASPSLEHQVLD